MNVREGLTKKSHKNRHVGRSQKVAKQNSEIHDNLTPLMDSPILAK